MVCCRAAASFVCTERMDAESSMSDEVILDESGRSDSLASSSRRVPVCEGAVLPCISLGTK